MKLFIFFYFLTLIFNFSSAVYVSINKDTGALELIDLQAYFTNPSSFAIGNHLPWIRYDATTGPVCTYEIDAQHIPTSNTFKIDQWLLVPNALGNHANVVIIANIYDLQLIVDTVMDLGIWDQGEPTCEDAWYGILSKFITPLLQRMSINKTFPGLHAMESGVEVSIFCNGGDTVSSYEMMTPCTEQQLYDIMQFS
jgi:hypothetical protein